MEVDAIGDLLTYLLSAKKSWLSEDNIVPAFSSLVATYSSETSGKQTIKIEECSRGINIEETVVNRNEACRSKIKMDTSVFGLAKISGGEISYECDFCQKCFATKSLIIPHRRKHTGEKPYKCSICSKDFRKKGYLTEHMRVHTIEKPFKCTICSKEFRVKRSLIDHTRVHTGETYKCTICCREFCVNGRLKRHLMTHTVDKLHKCSICSKSFQDKCNLTRHVRIHTSER